MEWIPGVRKQSFPKAPATRKSERDSQVGLGGTLFGYASYFTMPMSPTNLHFTQKK